MDTKFIVLSVIVGVSAPIFIRFVVQVIKNYRYLSENRVESTLGVGTVIGMAKKQRNLKKNKAKK